METQGNENNLNTVTDNNSALDTSSDLSNSEENTEPTDEESLAKDGGEKQTGYGTGGRARIQAEKLIATNPPPK
jgi:hypothetical protein